MARSGTLPREVASMVDRWGRGLVFGGFLAFVGAAPGVAQGTLSGELVAADVAGYVVIACFADAELGCDEARSGLAEISGGGTRAAWTIEGLERGPFLVLGWRDVDGDGEAQEHELIVLNDAAGEPRLFTAPAAGLLLRAPDAPAAPDGPVRRSSPSPAPSPTPAPAVPSPGPATPTPSPVAPTPPVAAALHPDLVGVWQQTRASGGDYRDLATGSTFSMTSGFSSMLKLREDASFVFQFYSSGVASDCALVSHLDTAVGSAALEAGALVLRPTRRWVEVTACARSGTYEPGLDPMVLPAQLTESFDFDGHRTWTLALEGGPVPLELTLLHRPPSPTPPQPAEPDDFVVGADPPYSDIQGVWAPYPGSDLGFFEPTTNAFYLPEYNGSTHQWLRLTPDGYDLARAWPSYNDEGVCTKDYVYYERGRADFVVLEDIGGQGDHFRGHVRFVGQDARVVVRITDCGNDDATLTYAMTPQISYYEWRYRAESDYIVHIPAGFSLSCPWSRSEWQFMICDGWSVEASFGRR
jgi:hypothetical protein